MIKPLQIRSAVFGTGMPKICIPLTSSGKRDLADEARALLSASPDLVEWRVDYFEQSDSLIEVRMMLSALRDILKDIPLLFTFRTNDEGGQKRISPEDYHLLCRTACKSGCIDLLDAELSQGESSRTCSGWAPTCLKSRLCRNPGWTRSRSCPPRWRCGRSLQTGLLSPWPWGNTALSAGYAVNSSALP